MNEINRELGLFGNYYIPEFAVGNPVVVHYTISGDSEHYVAIRQEDTVDEDRYPKEIVIEKEAKGYVIINHSKSPYFFDALIKWIEVSLEELGIHWHITIR